MIKYPEGGMPGILLRQRQQAARAGINNVRVQLIPLRPVPKYKITGPESVAALVREMEDYDREYAKILHLDSKNQVMGVENISIGSLSATIVHPREAVKGAILANSASVIFLHNHPSGICEASPEDDVMHTKLTEAFNLVGIKLLDSIIVGKGCYYAFSEGAFARTPVQVPLTVVAETEEEFAALEETARKRLAESFELIRKNEELEREIKRLREELAKAPPVAAPLVPAPAAPPAVHGSMYQEYRRRIKEVARIADINKLAAEVLGVAEKEEYGKLTKGDIAELLDELRRAGERRAMQLAEMRIKPVMIRKPAIRAARRAVLPSRAVAHRYAGPDIQEATFEGKKFVRDHELEKTILRNSLLQFPPEFYSLPPEEKVKRFSMNLAGAFWLAVEQKKLSWQALERDYGIPHEYINGWRQASGSSRYS